MRISVAFADSALILTTGASLTSVTATRVPLAGEASSSIGFSPRPVSLSFADSMHGWMSGQRGLLSTVDGGVSWKDISPGRAKKTDAEVSARPTARRGG